MRVHVRSFALLLSLWFFNAGWPLSAAPAPISGRVVDPDGKAVRGATVLLVDGAAVVSTAVTDAAGGFTLTTPRDGEFGLRVSAAGFRSLPVTVAAGNDAGTIRLEVSAVRESVVVSAAHVDIPSSATGSSVTILTSEQLEAIQARSLPDAIRLVPGLSVATAGGTGAQTSTFPRGGESDYSLVFIDGVQANAFGGGFDFAHVPLAGVERVEIVRGPQSALYGSNAIGSVVRIVSKRGAAPTAEALVEGGSFATARVTGAGAASMGTWQWNGAADRVSSDGAVENDDYQRWTIAGGMGWAGRNGARVRADAHYTDDDRGFPGPYGSDPGGTFEGLDTVSRGNNDRLLASVGGAISAGPKVRLSGLLSHSSIDGSVVSAFGPSQTFSRRTGTRLQADLAVARSLHASIGADVQRERAGSTFITAADSREVPVRRTLAGTFAELRWTRESRLFLTGGVRAERISRSALAGSPNPFAPRPEFDTDVITSVDPKIAVAWFATSSGGSFTKIRAAAGSGFRPPDAFEIAFTDNPALKPERSRSAEAGLDLAFAGGRASLEATAFYNRYDDLIVATGSFAASRRYRTENISNARTRGVELSGAARARTPLGGGPPLDAELRIAVTLLDSEILAVDSGTSAPPPFSPGDRLLRRPRRQVAAELTVGTRAFSAFVTAGGRSRTLDVDPSFGTFGGLFEAPGYAVVNVGASWRGWRTVEVFGRLTNLFDRDYEEVLGFPALGRGAVAGLRIAAGR